MRLDEKWLGNLLKIENGACRKMIDLTSFYGEIISKIDAQIPNIRISEARLYISEQKYYKPFVIATGRSVVSRNFLIFLYTRNNIFGVGEAGLPRENIEAFFKDAFSILQSYVGKTINFAVRDFLKRNNLSKNLRLGIATALLDLATREMTIRFGEIFGKLHTEEILTDITIGIEDIESTEKDLRFVLDNGFKIIKLKVGSGDLKTDLKRIKLVNERIPEDCKLRIDANQGWTLEDAVNAIKFIETEGIQLEFIEQPLKKDKISEIGKLRDMTEIPILIDESIQHLEDLDKVSNFVDGVNIKITKAGDPVEAFLIGINAKELGLKVMIGCSGESNIGITVDSYLASTIPVDYADLDSDILKEDILKEKVTKVINSKRILPRDAGLGIHSDNIIWEKLSLKYMNK